MSSPVRRPRSLKRVLGVQWALFASALLFGMFTLSAVALYVLEDSFIDARLREAERAFRGERAPLPQIEVRRMHELPQSVRGQLEELSAQDYDPIKFRVRELRVDRDHYLHVRALPADAEGPRFLVFEAQDELRVTSALLRAGPSLGLLLLLILLHAAWLARRFVGRVEHGAASLLEALEREPSALSLRSAAERQPVEEFQRFGRALADALEARLAALQREEDTLRFLAHELRTPLQAARLAAAALPIAAGGERAQARLQRALQRLERASAAVLWLGESSPAAEPVEVGACLRALCEELAPLAAQRDQRFTLQLDAALHWPLPIAAVEAVLGNLLLNAIQHGALGLIELRAHAHGLDIGNACPQQSDSAGFGLGLELSRRLLARIGWSLQLSRTGERAEVAIRVSAEQ
jgi:signal transduction histidine kinase